MHELNNDVEFLLNKPKQETKMIDNWIKQLQAKKLERPEDYNHILNCCIDYVEDRIDRNTMLRKINLCKISWEQFSHIMTQAKNLCGKNFDVRNGAL
jgi:hypothetical protein